MEQSSTARPARRVALTAVTFLGVCLLTAAPLAALFGLGGVKLLIPFLVAVVFAGYVWAHADRTPGYLLAFGVYGALVGGGTGFIAGFFGPMLLAPGANQGPLLGIFITGPAGALVGAVAGVVVALARKRRGVR